MNLPTDYGVIATKVTKKTKRLIINYTRFKGTTITHWANEAFASALSHAEEEMQQAKSKETMMRFNK